jgi:superfamily II DNA or RNA helicase
MQLWPKQEEALARLVPARRVIYGDAAGSGKTAVSIRTAQAWDSERTLVLASGEEILDQWITEARVWDSELFPIKGYGTKPQRAEARDRAQTIQPSMLVLNYEALIRDVDDLIKVGFDTVIFDEAHNLKNRQSATFKAAAKLARRATNVLPVTGTPILNSAEEAWSMLHLIDPKRYSSFHRWTGEHFEVEITDFHGTIPQPIRLIIGLKPGHADLVRAELAPLLVQRPFEELFPDAIPPEITTVEVELGEEERRAYAEIDRRDWTQIGDLLVQTSNAVSKTTRLRQIASSWATLGGDTGGAKIEAAMQIDQKLVGDEQVLVLSAYQETARQAALALGGVAYTGDLKKPVRRTVLDAFKRGELRVLSATIGMLGEGVDGLQVARNLIQLDRDWTPARNEQVLARLRRGGQERQVRAWYIHGNKTVDDDVTAALSRKTGIIASIV